MKFGQVVESLTGGRHQAWELVGLDPDVRPDAVPRHDGWRGLFGQLSASQTHLANQRVGAGDVFLFFGLFRRVQETREGWRFVRGEPQQHILWGWLQIEQVCKVDEIRNDERFDWATYHCQFSWSGDPKNTLYVATDQLDLQDIVTAPGAGVFPRFDERLALTKPGGSASQWRLPRWFYPDDDKTPLTYHPRNLWRHDDDYAYVQRRGPVRSSCWTCGSALRQWAGFLSSCGTWGLLIQEIRTLGQIRICFLATYQRCSHRPRGLRLHQGLPG